MLTVCYLSRPLFLFCCANFAVELPQPRNNSRGTKDTGNHAPDRPEFCLLQPRPGNRETARTAGRSDRASAIKRRLFLPALFSLSNTHSILPAKAGPNLPKTSWWRRYPPLPRKRPHSGPQGRTAGKPPFSLFSIAIFNMPVYISWPHYSRKL